MRLSTIGEWVLNFIILIFATSTIAQPFVIPSASMESSLMTGDHVLVDKMAYAPPGAWTSRLLPYEPVQRGNIVVFRYPVDEKQMFVKRVIGLPGDRIRLRDKQVWRNGVMLDEPYTQHVFPPNEYRDNFPDAVPTGGLFPGGAQMLECCVRGGELVVPANSYFVMGDNRDNSSDSRYWGFVPAANIVGKPVLVWWSYRAGDDELTDFVNVRHLADLATHFFTKTRWDRTMRVVRS
jgi:signal peptidase I